MTMGGFGPDKPDPKPATTGEALTRTMQSTYDELRREGGTVAQVHARIKGTDRWYVIGHVSVCTQGGIALHNMMPSVTHAVGERQGSLIATRRIHRRRP